MREKRKSLEPHIKQSVYRRDNGKCAYCGRHRNIKYMTIDHIIPISKGGTDDMSNLQCTCKACNNLKEDMFPSEFTDFIRHILRNSMEIEKAVVKGGATV